MTELDVVSGESFNADIYIAGDLSTIEQTCREWVDRGACVTVTPTRFVFTGGTETGARIGFINYQRFPSTPEAITGQAIDLAKELIARCYQFSASVVTSHKTFFISNDRKR